MHTYSISTSFEHDPTLTVSLTINADSEEAAVQSVLSYLRMEFELPTDATYSYRAS